MKSTKKLIALLLTMAVVLSLLAGCGDQTQPTGDDGTQAATDGNVDETTPSDGASAEGSQYGGHLNMVIKSRPTSLDPVKATSSWNQYWANCIYEPILGRDADNNIVPAVCDFELSDDLTDVKLWPREGYVFSGGYGQVDVYDVEASFNRGLSKQSSIKKYVAPYVQSVTVENDGEKDYLHVVFSEYNEMNLYYLASTAPWWAVMPVEICQKYSSANIMDQKEDAIGTGPYVVTDLEDSIQVTLTKREDYVAVDNSMYTGAAGTKYGYMDTITFWYNGTDASCALGLMGGEYDMTEAIPVDYKAMAESAGISLTIMPSNQRTWVFFNTVGTANLCSKYPSLRKAVMAAINYEGFLDVITDSAQIMEGDNAGIVLDPKYATDAFTSQDYYGAASQEVVDKYLAEARAEGYNDEPLQLCFSGSRTDMPTMFRDALETHGINYEISTLEGYAASQFLNDPSNNWDFQFSWGVSAYTPSLLSDTIMVTNFGNERKDEILEQMRKLEPGCDEYMALWDELAWLMADGCYVGYMSAIDWWWWHPEDLVINNDEGLVRFVYNCYWKHPADHTKVQ